MCAPAIISAAIGLAGTLYQTQRQNAIAAQNESAADDWAAYQQRMRRQETKRQAKLRQQADAARTGGLEDMQGEKQDAARTEEQARLETVIGPSAEEADINNTVSNALLSGQERGSQIFQDTLKNKLAEATKTAQERISALAKLQSYGGSLNGLELRNQTSQLDAGNQIDFFNNRRTGSLSAYGAEKAVNPVQYFG